MTESPYELPKGWRWVRLGEAAEVKYGKARPPESGSIPVVGSGGVYAYTKTPLVSNPTVIVGRKGSAGEPLLMREPCWPSDTTFYLVWKFDVHAEWVALWLTLNKPSATGTSATLPSIRRQDLESHLLPLPPLPEQRRIVARVEELMERVREAWRLREEAKKEADRLMQASLAEVFPRPGAPLPPGWRWVRLEEVACREAKTIKPSDIPDHVFNYLGMEHVTPDQWEEPKPEPHLGVEIRSSVIMFWPGLVLYGKLRPYLNKVVVPSTEGVASTEFVPIKPDVKLLLPSFLGAFLRSPSFVSYATSNTTGSRQPRIRMEALWNTLVPLPPLPEQRRIVAYLDQIQARVAALKKAQEATEAELHRLEQAILEKAFRGEL